ncbi:MAG TPA: nucleotide exchange factor GrpE [Candidatus Saccharimonadales bacterium]|nr:nucleotide exchange factor GrpE [Candidatus Saccharimonadales bacterium]
MKKNDSQIQELTNDLQRVRADFENYRKRMEIEKLTYADAAKAATVLKLLPVIDNIDRAVAHIPAELTNNKWAQGVVGLNKNLEKSLDELGLTRINAEVGVDFNPELHEAISMEDEGGDHEVIAEELRPGYKLGENVIRPSMVRVKK